MKWVNQIEKNTGQLTDMYSMGQLRSLRNVNCQPPACFSPDGMISVIAHDWLHVYTHQHDVQSVNGVRLDEQRFGKKKKWTAQEKRKTRDREEI